MLLPPVFSIFCIYDRIDRVSILLLLLVFQTRKLGLISTRRIKFVTRLASSNYVSRTPADEYNRSKDEKRNLPTAKIEESYMEEITKAVNDTITRG